MSDTKSLIAYFSRKGNNYVGGSVVNLPIGNTEVIAKKIQELSGSEMFEIKTVKSYPEDYTETTKVAMEEKRKNTRPELADIAEEMDSYNVIYLGYFEETSEELIGRQMETNVFGTMKLTRAVLPMMRKQGSGSIIVFSSAMGIVSMEGGSVYSASKFALEGWIEGMKIELKPFGIRCMLVEPGPFRTDFVNEKTSVKFSDLEIDDYKEQREAMHDVYVSFHGKEPGDPAKLAKALMTAVNDSNPPLRLLLGKGMVGLVDQYYKGRLSEYEAWREVSESTNFE